METKWCPKCETDRPINDFVFKNKAKGLRQPSCKFCTRLSSQKYYRSNVKEHVERSTKSRKNKQVQFQKLKSTLKCAVCNENTSVCLDMHHKDDSTKDFDMSHLYYVGWELIFRELAKCVVLCSNCHRKAHAGLISIENQPTLGEVPHELERLRSMVAMV